MSLAGEARTHRGRCNPDRPRYEHFRTRRIRDRSLKHDLSRALRGRVQSPAWARLLPGEKRRRSDRHHTDLVLDLPGGSRERRHGLGVLRKGLPQPVGGAEVPERGRQRLLVDRVWWRASARRSRSRFGELCVEQVDDLERDRGLLSRVKRELKAGEEPTAGRRAPIIRRRRRRHRWCSVGADPLGRRLVRASSARRACAAGRKRHCGPCLGGAPASGQPTSDRTAPPPSGVGTIGCFARRMRPRGALVSTGSAGCTIAPKCASARHTNSQTVHASTATCASRPGKPGHSCLDRRRRRLELPPPQLPGRHSPARPRSSPPIRR